MRPSGLLWWVRTVVESCCKASGTIKANAAYTVRLSQIWKDGVQMIAAVMYCLRPHPTVPTSDKGSCTLPAPEMQGTKCWKVCGLPPET
jgi:hypothetical protein